MWSLVLSFSGNKINPEDRKLSLNLVRFSHLMWHTAINYTGA